MKRILTGNKMNHNLTRLFENMNNIFLEYRSTRSNAKTLLALASETATIRESKMAI